MTATCPQAVQELQYVAGDTLPDLSCVYENVNITGYTITLHIKYREHVLVKTATITDGPGGQFVFTWETGDLQKGRWKAEIQIINGSGKPLTFTGLLFDVVDSIA